jgi:polyhydroxybutyrate depolymerase
MNDDVIARPHRARPKQSRSKRAMLNCFVAALLAMMTMNIIARPAHATEPALITLSDGTYRALAPPYWDGKRKLPLVLYLHGFREDSATIMAREDLVEAATSLGALFVVPDGMNKGWSHRGAPGQNRDDIAFLHEVVRDAETHYPIDTARVFAAGFSIGASMVWDLACHGADGFTAFLPFSGDFWMPYPQRCESGPVDLRHTHADNDHTFPMAGRPLFGGKFQQGNLHQSLAILEATDGCAVDPDKQSREGELDCESWSKCSSGKMLELCIHHGDHQIEGTWLKRSIEWALKRTAAKPLFVKD